MKRFQCFEEGCIIKCFFFLLHRVLQTQGVQGGSAAGLQDQALPVGGGGRAAGPGQQGPHSGPGRRLPGGGGRAAAGPHAGRQPGHGV